MNKATAGTATVALMLLAGCRSPLDATALRTNKAPAAKRPSAAETELPDFGPRTASRDDMRWAGAEELKAPRHKAEAGLSGTVDDALMKGRKAAAQGNLAEAEEQFQRVLTRDPTHPEAHHRLAVFADQRQDYATAERHYKVALAGRPNDPDLLSDVGYSAMLQGRLDEAENYLREALRHDAGHRLALLNLGTLCAQTGREAQAMAAFRLAGSEEEAQRHMAQAKTSGPPPGTDPTRWLREQMDRAKAHDVAQRQLRQQVSQTPPAAYGEPPHPGAAWNDPRGPQTAVAAYPPHGEPLNRSLHAVDSLSAQGLRDAHRAAAPGYVAASHSWGGPHITPGQPTQGFRDGAVAWPEAQAGGVSAPDPTARGSAVSPAGYADAAAPHAYQSAGTMPQNPVASWDAAPAPWPHAPTQNGGAPAPAGTEPPQWPAAPHTAMSQPSGYDAPRAAYVGRPAGPGELHPAAHEAAPISRPGQWPNTPAARPASSAAPASDAVMTARPADSYRPAAPQAAYQPAPSADPLEQFQRTVRRQQEELDQLRRQLEAARQSAPTGPAAQPAPSSGYGAQPAQWPQPAPPTDWPQYAPQSGTPTPPADYSPPPYNPATYTPPQYPGAR